MMRIPHVVALLVFVGASGRASGQESPRAKAPLLLEEGYSSEASDDGATIDSQTETVIVVPPPVRLFPTFVEFHSARVENDLMLFQPTLVGIAPQGRARSSDLLVPARAAKAMRFLAPPVAADDLAVHRDRDRQLLFRGPQPQGAAVAIGLAMFAVTTILSAHAPRPVRVVFDGPVHLGPAIFDGGGMGAGIAGRL